MSALKTSSRTNPGAVRWLIRALIGICLLVAASRLGIAIVLYGWKNDWPPGLVYAVSLAPWIAVIAIFGWLIWRDHQARQRSMTAPPKRHWFRFGLRTLFVLVTIVCALSGWLAWNLRQMRHRIETARTIELRGGSIEWGWIYTSDLKLVPSLWRFLGADPMFCINLPSTEFSKEEAASIREVFPESLVCRRDPDWQNLYDGQ
jgi:hypothetical protein